MDQESTVLNLTVITTVDGNESPINTTNLSAHPINTLQEPVLPPRTPAPNSTILTSQTSQHRRGTSVPTTHICTKLNNSDSTNYQHRTGTSVATTHVCTKLNNSDTTHYQHAQEPVFPLRTPGEAKSSSVNLTRNTHQQ